MRMILVTTENCNGMIYFRTDVFDNDILTQSFYQLDLEGIRKDIEIIQKPSPSDDILKFNYQLSSILNKNQINISK